VAGLFAGRDRPIASYMRHIVLQADDLPVPPPLFDRRKTPDRRAVWRGGRRDSDWTSRPLGALTRIERDAIWRARWRRALSTLHLW
jgi:hypothetical protein